LHSSSSLPQSTQEILHSSRLIDTNLNTSIDDVNCEVCKKKTLQKVSWSLKNDILGESSKNDFLLLEILRGEERSKHLTTDIIFDPAKVIIEDNIYQVIATAHHSGGISSGHWITKIKLRDNSWWLLDTLKSSPQKTISPGLQIDKGSLVLLLLMKFK